MSDDDRPDDEGTLVQFPAVDEALEPEVEDDSEIAATRSRVQEVLEIFQSVIDGDASALADADREMINDILRDGSNRIKVVAMARVIARLGSLGPINQVMDNIEAELLGRQLTAVPVKDLAQTYRALSERERSIFKEAIDAAESGMPEKYTPSVREEDIEARVQEKGLPSVDAQGRRKVVGMLKKLAERAARDDK